MYDVAPREVRVTWIIFRLLTTSLTTPMRRLIRESRATGYESWTIPPFYGCHGCLDCFLLRRRPPSSLKRAGCVSDLPDVSR